MEGGGMILRGDSSKTDQLVSSWGNRFFVTLLC